MDPTVHGTHVQNNHLPPVDDSRVSLDEEAITTAGNYDGDFVDLGPNYSGGLSMFFVFAPTLAGGTSIQPILLADADGVAGSEYAEQTARAIATASLPRFYEIVIPADTRYVKGRVATLGTYTAGSVTAYVGKNKPN